MHLNPVPPFSFGPTALPVGANAEGYVAATEPDATRAGAPPDDLRWWLQLAPTLEWTWARTYASTAPHWYVVLGRTPGLTVDDYVRVGRTIRTFGEPGVFHSSTNLYLYTGDRGLKFWCMWSHEPQDGEATLVNLATTERSYGDRRAIDLSRVRRLRLSMPLPD
ncbi:hypothetical protein GA707_18150 [Nostocoides sp. F2B08]|uniref:hypothetical protein n=1 Tax=Nostocoides sp. F2B08 TaxID=2653936 RepID=UPI001262D29E|nr:hypothetical protein [Tetrasphaera sp. F2B08]KAB7741010.1 hypothetical protein GA707_18150 [Tetrasphaera sp. F2B08]